ncbi:hypothetical protein MMYC01_204261 [Madurella mycetomatis]|uniref:Uncharacterized protein n=1 Tax=Madurella mycetomatis TaxID=100816 RepID=A0A175W3L2_9PEZI|nr:hypothetical protein MMYC01_204261 [Madurella mycetomatis]
MAFPRHPSPDVQFPIVLIPDVDDEGMDSDTEPEVEARDKTSGDIDEPQAASAPEHPIPSMQQAFAESLIEATHGDVPPKPKLRTGDAKARREELLDQGKSDAPPTALWRRRPGQKTHELCRLMAQISFGVYLLLNGMANSQILVVSILQGHIDEVDEFLETTLEDMDLASKDMKDRIEHLRLPMDNIGVFERMLEDRNFRLQILEGNQKIEHILARTRVALKQTMQDLTEGLTVTRDFTIYLAEQQHGQWRQERPDVIDIFDAMKGNTDGWFKAFMDLQAKGSSLNALIVRLAGIVSEMERRAGEVSRRTRFGVEPYTSPKHSPRPSEASSVMTPPSSPPRKVPNSPPRLSLRLSTINTVAASETSYFDLSIGFESQPAATQGSTHKENQKGQEEAAPHSPPELVTNSPPSPPPPQSPPARNPRRLSERPAAPIEAPKLEAPEGKNEDEESTLYILQPRTYTPQPPSPQPSPRIIDEPPKTAKDTDIARAASPASSVELAAPLKLEPPKPRAEQALPKPQAYRPRVVEIGARTDPKHSPKRNPRPDHQPVTRPDPALAPELVVEPEQEQETQARQRTSLRERISLKTNLPESIHVPPPNTLERQRPSQPAPRLYQAPDSAYGSDMERPPINSIASMNSSLADFVPPFVQPGVIPSPHSDRQFFRPVQANPYSPLQQRPHTSGTAGPHHFPPPPRNIPSAMGMSVMSSGTTMTNATGKTLKKKRSAFGWLKKAFSLDEEERAAFEQKKREQAVNPYYNGRSPQFLDGKRIHPRPA